MTLTACICGSISRKPIASLAQVITYIEQAGYEGHSILQENRVLVVLQPDVQAFGRLQLQSTSPLPQDFHAIKGANLASMACPQRA